MSKTLPGAPPHVASARLALATLGLLDEALSG